jgi:hypothetical protein
MHDYGDAHKSDMTLTVAQILADAVYDGAVKEKIIVPFGAKIS